MGSEGVSVPAWVRDAVFYQIFPDRFANGDPSNDPPNVQPWGAKPTLMGFQGGDLQGVIQRFDYLLELGVTAIYLNPIFQATSNHRYNTTDYLRIDPKLGSKKDFQAFLKVAHNHGVRVILDGVFNHCGRGFFAFNDIMENQAHSPYRDWFHLEGFPVNAYRGDGDPNYGAWWQLKSLPKFKTDNPAVRRYLLDVARYWIEQGADGWRLDVPNEIDDDEFWAEFRTTVKGVNPDAYLVGEIWDVDARWVGPGHFDGLMNYPLRDRILEFLARRETKASVFLARVSSVLDAYPREHVFAHYLPLGSHDTRRLKTVCKGNMAWVRLAFVTQFCLPGAPAIYYGDEIGLEGEKDPDCRRAFPSDPKVWDHDLLSFVKRLTSLRHLLKPLREGDYQPVLADDGANICAFGRISDGQAVALVINASDLNQDIGIPTSILGWEEGQVISEALTGGVHRVENGMISLHLPGEGAAMLHNCPTA
jgi:cyclomaltodextrinase